MNRDEEMLRGKFYQISIGIILVLLILYLFSKVEYIFGPLKALGSFLLIPFLVSLFLYYLLRPSVKFLTQKLKYKNISILLSFFLLIILLLAISYFGGSIIQKQIFSLSKDFSNYYEYIKANIENTISGNDVLLSYLKNFEIGEKITLFAENVFSTIKNNFFGFFSAVTNFGTMLFLIPFILYYFLKDDKVIYNIALSLIPENKRKNISDILLKIDDTLSKYIGGQLIIALFIGLLTYIGFIIIGLQNALILSLIIIVTSFIPFIGAFIGSIPAVLIGLSSSLFMTAKVIIVIIFTQQIEGNFIQPKVQGNRLSIHPLMVIVVVISFVTLFGILGALFAVPAYAVVRIIIGEIYKKRISN